MELAQLFNGAAISKSDLGKSRTARKAGFGAKASMVIARRSHGVANSFIQRRPVTDDERGPSRDLYLWSRTKPEPWKVRERNRRRNAIARASRKANRP